MSGVHARRRAWPRQPWQRVARATSTPRAFDLVATPWLPRSAYTVGGYRLICHSTMHAWALVCPASVQILETLLSSSRSRLRLAPHEQLVQIVSRCTPPISGGRRRSWRASVPSRGAAVLRPSRNLTRRRRCGRFRTSRLFMFDRDLRFLFCEGSRPASRRIRSRVDAGPDAARGARRSRGRPRTDVSTRASPARRWNSRPESEINPIASGPRQTRRRGWPRRRRQSAQRRGDGPRVPPTACGRESLERLDRIASNVPGAVYQARVDADGRDQLPLHQRGHPRRRRSRPRGRCESIHRSFWT